MKRFILAVLVFACSLTGIAQSGDNGYADWNHSGSFYLLSDAEGADLPGTASELNFPVLIRLNSDFFDFSEADAQGKDLRFSSEDGSPLSFQIEEWKPDSGKASIWVRIPVIKGNERQKVNLHWGNYKADSQSDGNAVFNTSNGFLSVFHMDSRLQDEVGIITATDNGSVAAKGVIGEAREFQDGSHLFCGDDITAFPSGNEERSTSAWLNANDAGWAIDWGMEARCQENSIKFEKPGFFKNEGYLCDVFGETRANINEWNHVTVTYKNEELVIYLNGEEDGRSVRSFATPDTAYFRIGKRHNSPDNPWGRQWWNGEIDEVRIANRARSADWIKLEYQNQKELNTLVGPLVSPGDEFAVSSNSCQVLENQEVTIPATIEGAQKIYWYLRNNDDEVLVAVDKLSYTFRPGRVTGNQVFSLIIKAVYPGEIKTREVDITVLEDIPDPVFTLSAPVVWNGRDTIEVIPFVGNLEQLTDNGVADLNYSWNLSEIAVVKDIRPGKLVLERAQKSGMARVELSIDNGGAPSVQSIAIKVEEPKIDKWIHRQPGPEEKPENNRFYAREDDNKATLYYNGHLKRRASFAILRIYADDELYYEEWQKPAKRKSYNFTTRIEAGLVQYRVELWSRNRTGNTLVEKFTNIVCGDAYLINGQSNAEAYDYGNAVNTYSSNWLRSYGSSSSDPEKSTFDKWGRAVSFDKGEAKQQIGYWGMELGKMLILRHKMPVCFINGAKGGSRIDQHLRNNDMPEDQETIYGRLLRRVKAAGLTHGIRGVIWHQGENDQGAAGPGNVYGWETYHEYFKELSASWIEDYPNIKNYYVFQIWPDACSMGRNGSGDRLREAQRTLSRYYSNMDVMSTIGIRPGGGCHFPPEGYDKMADLILPLLERDHYGQEFDKSITAPNLVKAYYTGERRNRIAIEFDQPVDWDNRLKTQFYLDGDNDWVVSGSLWGNKIILQLKSRCDAEEISYLDGKNWDQDNILYGRNGIAALTFYEVPILTFNPQDEEPDFIMERSRIEQPYPYISTGSFSGPAVPESPDPLISYRWPNPKASDKLEIFVLKPIEVDTDTPESFDQLESLIGDQTMVKVKGPGSIRLDFGLEMPAWIEFDSPDYPGGVEMSISEYNQPGINKTAEPVKHGDTYRLELNEELYEGVRFAWIHVNYHNKDWHIFNVRAINQVKPTNYAGSFSCSDQMLTRIWYTSAYSVKASLCEDYFGAILMDRGDRMSWTGDAHPIQAASLVAFANYDFIKKNLENTSNQNNGIRSYSLYWVLSLLDYYYYTGDRETLESFIRNASNKLDDAYIDFGTDPDLRFYGWDERLCAGFELWFKPAPEAQNAYKMLSVRTWLEFANAMKEIGREDLYKKYSGFARVTMSGLRAQNDWLKNFGMHAAADAINTSLLTQKDYDRLYMDFFVHRANRLSLSPFNQYFIIQALAQMNKYDDAMSTVRDLWGGMIKQGATTTYEVFQPSWNDFLEPNDPVPNSQSGIVSLCHPWGAGPVKWLSEEILGIKPVSAGFETFEIKPHPGRTLEWIKGSTPTPFGDISVSLDLLSGTYDFSAPEGTKGRVGIPKIEKSVSEIIVNGELLWDGDFHTYIGIKGVSQDDDYVYLDGVVGGDYEIEISYTGSTPFYVEPHVQYKAQFIREDSTTSGNWGGVYGQDGYVLINYNGNGDDISELPAYLDSISFFRAFPRTPEHKPDYLTWAQKTRDSRALASDESNGMIRNAGGVSNADQTFTMTANVKGTRKYQVALYFVDWESSGASQAIEMFDAKTLNMIAPVKMVEDYSGGKYLIYKYDKAAKFRINKIRGKNISLSGVFFDPY